MINKLSFGEVHLRPPGSYDKTKKEFPDAQIFSAGNCSTGSIDDCPFAVGTEGETQSEILDALYKQGYRISRLFPYYPPGYNPNDNK